jgi:hypothetical protein
MQKRIVGFLGIFIIILGVILFSQNAFADIEFIDNIPSNTTGWKFLPAPVIKNSTLEISYTNHFKDRDKCETRNRLIYKEHKGLFIVSFLVESELSQEELSVFENYLWNQIYSRRGPTERFLEKFEKNKINDEINTLNSSFQNKSFKFFVEKKEGDFELNFVGQSILKNVDDYNLAYLYLIDHCGFYSDFSYGGKERFYDREVNLAKAVFKFNSTSEDKKENGKDAKNIEPTDILDVEKRTDGIRLRIKKNHSNQESDDYIVFYSFGDYNVFEKVLTNINSINDKIEKNEFLTSSKKNELLKLESDKGIFIYRSTGFFQGPNLNVGNNKKLNAIAINLKNLGNVNEIINMKKALSNYLEYDIDNNQKIDSKKDLQTKKLSATFETKVTDNMICQGNVCFFREWEETLTKIRNADQTKPLYIGSKHFTNIENLNRFNINISSPNPETDLSKVIGNNIVSKISLKDSDVSLDIDGENITQNYFLKILQEDLSETYLFILKLDEEKFNQLLEFQVYRKILNDVYCIREDCKIPQYMLFDLFKDIVCDIDQDTDFSGINIYIDNLNINIDNSKTIDTSKKDDSDLDKFDSPNPPEPVFIFPDKTDDDYDLELILDNLISVYEDIYKITNKEIPDPVIILYDLYYDDSINLLDEDIEQIITKIKELSGPETIKPIILVPDIEKIPTDFLEDNSLIFEEVQIDTIDLEHLRDKSQPSDDPCKIYYVPGDDEIDPKEDDEDLSEDDGDFKYYPELNYFNIFDLNKDIGVDEVLLVTGMENRTDVEKTYFLEFIETFKNLDYIKDVPNYKNLFVNEIDNFGLEKNDLAIFFSIIGGESSFKHDAVAKNNEGSYGFVQLHKDSWNNQNSYNLIENYFPQEHRGFEKFSIYFTNIEDVDANYSLYLSLAVFKYHKNKIENMSVKNNKSYNEYTDIEKAFIHFYNHQLSRHAINFFENYNPKKEVVINCDPNINEFDHEKPTAQFTANNKLECFSTVGSVRKMAWYIWYLNNVSAN